MQGVPYHLSVFVIDWSLCASPRAEKVTMAMGWQLEVLGITDSVVRKPVTTVPLAF